MLASRNRLKATRDISRVFQRGRYGANGLVAVKAASNGRPDSRAVVVVSKKVSKRAVVRNRNRRRVSGVLESGWQTLGSGYDIVITVRGDLADLTASQVEQTVTRALQQAGLLKKV